MTLTERDEALIRVLLGKIRIISLDQITRTWWPAIRLRQDQCKAASTGTRRREDPDSGTGFCPTHAST